ncbi:MAG: pimeloyl-ACP methyl ester carboxylesterase [bacterium]|jgi:pimeloyl-ACP methyl ester carboxylesterase
MKIYAISGLGADERAFQFLQFPHEVVHITWITPEKDEPISDYAKRLCDQVDTSEPFALVGLSFGGMLATEMCKFIKPAHTILLSSAETKKEIPWWFKLIGKMKLTNVVPGGFVEVPRPVASWFFGTRNPELLDYILDDVDVPFVKWAVKQIMNWDNKSPATNVLKIYGKDDRVLPAKKGENTVMIKDGGHFMVADKAEEISSIIHNRLTT